MTASARDPATAALTSGSSTVTASSFDRPAAVWTDGNRVIVSDRDNNRVLLWNSWPTANNQPADLVLGQPEGFTRVFVDEGESVRDMLISFFRETTHTGFLQRLDQTICQFDKWMLEQDWDLRTWLEGVIDPFKEEVKKREMLRAEAELKEGGGSVLPFTKK